MSDNRWQRWTVRSVLAAAGLGLTTTMTGCVAVGYSSGGGWFVWPGGLGLVLLVLVLLFVLRGRR